MVQPNTSRRRWVPTSIHLRPAGRSHGVTLVNFYPQLSALWGLRSRDTGQPSATPSPTPRWPQSHRLPGQTGTWRDAPHHGLSEKCKSKLPQSTTSRQSEEPPLKRLQVTNTEEVVEKRDNCTVLYNAGGNVTWCRHYEKQHGGSSKN